MAHLDFDAWLKRRATDVDDAEIGEDVRRLVGEETEIEERGWAADLARAVADRVQKGDRATERKTPVVFWSGERTAFAAPGRYVYLSRRLLEESMPEFVVDVEEDANDFLGYFGVL